MRMTEQTWVLITSHPSWITEISIVELHLQWIQLPLASRMHSTVPEMMTRGQVLRHPALNITSQPPPFMSTMISQSRSHTSPPELVQALNYRTQIRVKHTHFHPHRSYPRTFIMLNHLPLSSLSLFHLHFDPLSPLWFLTDLNWLRSTCPSKELRSFHPVNFPPICFFPLSPCLILGSYYRPCAILFLLTYSHLPRCAMAPIIRQCTIRGVQRGALPGRYHCGEDNFLESIDGSSFSTFAIQCPAPKQRAESSRQAA